MEEDSSPVEKGSVEKPEDECVDVSSADNTPSAQGEVMVGISHGMQVFEEGTDVDYSDEGKDSTETGQDSTEMAKDTAETMGSQTIKNSPETTKDNLETTKVSTEGETATQDSTEMAKDTAETMGSQTMKDSPETTKDNLEATQVSTEGETSKSVTETAQDIAEGLDNSQAVSLATPDDGKCTAQKDVKSKKTCEDETNRTYYVKWILWKGVRTPIVTQNDNGPCPLLAIINILLLRRAIKFPSMQEMVTTAQLMEYLGDHVLKEIPENLGEGDQRNFEQNMQDALSILPKLKTGLDVNVKFTGVADFEFTPECVVFDLLNIHLYHGWLVDPQNVEYKNAIDGLSYNQLVEKIIASNEGDKEGQSSAEGLLAESFLRETANQLTYHGLCELNAKVKQDELCVFFRNNHFSTLYKHQNELFVLLTDQGFLTEDQIVWQTLPNVDGDGHFVDNSFKSLPMKEQPAPVHTVPSAGALSQEDQDYMLALSIQTDQQQENQATPLQQEEPASTSKESQAAEQPTPQEQGESTHNPSQQELLDLQYAMSLQEEENQRNQPPSGQQERRTTRRQTPPEQQYPSSSNQPRDSSGGRNCVLL